ncbi:MAG: hypothetical protein FWH11_09095 [Micrococcales bacterium]|nr:hypothetical protein [Micrococcales bacterium]
MEGLTHFAVVELTAEPVEDESVVVAAYTPCWQGWADACSAGIAYALARVPGRWKITVHEILGVAVDTTPTTVGYAAIRATYEATGHTIPDDETARLEAFVFGGGSPGFDAT